MKKHATVLSIVRAVFVRLLFMGHSLVAIWLVMSRLQNYNYLLLLICICLLLVESGYILLVRKGQEYLWFCPCFFFFLLSSVPAIWILELDRLARYTEIYENNNSTHVESLQVIEGVSLPITLSPSLWMSVIEQSFLFLIIIGRWILPRGELTRDKLSQLLFVYIGMASDIMDLFVLFEEPDVRKDKTYTYVILVIWSVSLLQFSVVLTATRSPKRSRAIAIHPEVGAEVEEDKTKGCSSCCSCLKTEIWSLLLSFMMQDGPFLTCRLYGLIRYNLITYSIIFYTCKNIFVVMLLLYRLFILCCMEPESETDKAAHRAVKKAVMVRNMSQKMSHGKISVVEDEYSNGGDQTPGRGSRGQRRGQKKPVSSASRKVSATRIVDID